MRMATCHPKRKHYTHGHCRPCADKQAKFYAANPEKMKAKRAAYVAANKGIVRVQNAAGTKARTWFCTSFAELISLVRDGSDELGAPSLALSLIRMSKSASERERIAAAQIRAALVMYAAKLESTQKALPAPVIDVEVVHEQEAA